MDRLPPVTLSLVLVALAGCGDDDGSTAAPPGRVVAVQAEEEEDPLASFCDSRDERPFALPHLATEPPPEAEGWRWVNVWATWCRPCIEEMPLLSRWSGRLEEDGHPVELTFLSADADGETVARFREEHGDVPDSARVADPEALPEWATTIGLDEGATLPIHVFVDPADRTRCVRTGAVDEDDYDTVRQLLASGS